MDNYNKLLSIYCYYEINLARVDEDGWWFFNFVPFEVIVRQRLYLTKGYTVDIYVYTCFPCMHVRKK